MNKMFESGTYINPFKIPDLPAELVHFATGSVSTPAIQKSLVEAFNKSKSMADTFAKSESYSVKNKHQKRAFMIL